ncbi:DUF3693 domain-containing protein [Methyloversatilis sp.]|uniref:DUF3693 domain-containing protein n=1 Tax=Methyloversatilis sp. TaxID=2569862 RepID=UPI003D291DA5
MQNTTQQLIEALRARQGGATDYRIAKNMGWTPQVLSKYRHGRSQLDNRGLLQVAAALELSAADVVRYMAQIEAERAHTDDQRATWAELCRQWGGHAAAVALVVLAGIAPAPADASQQSTRIDALQSATSYCFQNLHQYKRRTSQRIDQKRLTCHLFPRKNRKFRLK